MVASPSAAAPRPTAPPAYPGGAPRHRHRCGAHRSPPRRAARHGRRERRRLQRARQGRGRPCLPRSPASPSRRRLREVIELPPIHVLVAGGRRGFARRRPRRAAEGAPSTCSSTPVAALPSPKWCQPLEQTVTSDAPPPPSPLVASTRAMEEVARRRPSVRRDRAVGEDERPPRKGRTAIVRAERGRRRPP